MALMPIKEKLFFSSPVIGAFEQYGIAKPIAQAQINAYGRIYIAQHFFAGSFYLYFLHQLLYLV